jgi:hypothetical protein
MDQFAIMKSLFDDESGVDPDVISIFTAAGRFYLRALQMYQTSPDAAYLDLITCGEIISNGYQYTDEQMYDPALLKRFALIEEKVDPEGPSIVRDIKVRLYQVKRKFMYTMMHLLTPDFYQANEVEPHLAVASLDPESMENRLKAAYDLRSLYVHTGKHFGMFIKEESYEKPIFSYMLMNPKEKDFKKLVNKAPTFKGLERVLRFCLLQFLQTKGIIQLPVPAATTVSTDPPEVVLPLDDDMPETEQT